MRIIKQFLYGLGYGGAGIIIGAFALYTYHVRSGPKPELWHTTSLEHEFHASKDNAINELNAYLRLEDKLFKQVQKQIVDNIPPSKQRRLNRFSANALVNPAKERINWNRSFVLRANAPKGGILMLHGLSDSPYSMRSLAKDLHAQGFSIIALRLPGHGTAPSGLIHAHWRDFTSATRIAARHLHKQIGKNLPLHMVGYSNGAALAVEYSLAALEGEPLPMPETLIMLSPAISVSPVAALAHWQGKLSALPGFEQFAWTPILPEFDPYKYNSFAVNAGEQIYDLTSLISERMDRLSQSGRLNAFPKVVAFQSAVDATIPPDGIVTNLLTHLPSGDNHLVLFDINRFTEATPLLKATTEKLTRKLLADSALPFNLTVVTNQDESSRHLVARHKAPRSRHVENKPLNLEWPRGVYSLSHIALPFPPDDPWYGQASMNNPNTVPLGHIELHGEKGLLAIPSNFVIRLRYNPFYSYLSQKITTALALGTDLSPPITESSRDQHQQQTPEY